MSDDLPLPPEAWLSALAGLDGMGPARLGALLAAFPSPESAFAAVAAGTPAVRRAVGDTPDARRVAAAWPRLAGDLDVAAVWQRHVALGIVVARRGGPAFPSQFHEVACPPEVLYLRGDPAALDGPRVGLVGTRSCTRYGLDLARELGRDLALAGVNVVSGLALGIDGAAHAGVLGTEGAAPVGVVGTGLDVVYPRRHASLWTAVAERGVLVSEYPAGTGAAPWRFPARNRLIAALSDVLVVVESHATGGALLTADDANALGRTVLAVPGSVRSDASSGTNDLIADGIGVCRGTDDVLVALGISPGIRRASVDHRPAPDASGRLLLDALAWQPATLDQLLLRSSLDLGPLSLVLDRLIDDGWVVERGGWYEQIAGAVT